MAVDQLKIDRWFSYHTPRDDQKEKYEAIRAAGKEFAMEVLKHTPTCADQSTAIRRIRDAVAVANAAIACSGM